MKRRDVLAGIAGVAGLGAVVAYAVDAFGQHPLTLAVYDADGDETDARCDLPDGFLDDRPVLAGLVHDARGRDIDDPATRGISRTRGDDILDGLEANCETVGGLYRIDGEWYFISITGEDAHDHGDDGNDHGDDGNDHGDDDHHHGDDDHHHGDDEHDHDHSDDGHDHEH